MKQQTIVLVLAVGLGAWPAHAQTWTRFRGPNGQGIAETVNVPVQWSQADYRWKTALPGEGHSSCVLWGERLYVTCCDKSKTEGRLVALNAGDGSVVWQQPYALPKSAMNALNSYAASTPAVDADGVVVIWINAGDCLVAALDHAGQEKWKKSFGPTSAKHGPCVSPVLYKDLVLFAHEQEDDKAKLRSCWVALDRKTGDIRWSLDRDYAQVSHAAPCLIQDSEGRDRMVFTSKAHGVTALDPATGTVAWEVSGIFNGRTIGSPVLAGDLIVATCGAGGGGKVLVAVRPPQADKTAETVYTSTERMVPFIPTPLVVRDRLYLFHDGGDITCLDTRTWKVLWSAKHKGKFFGSPIAVGDRIYCPDADGNVMVLRAGDAYEVLAANALGEPTQATPAVANGCLYLRTLTSVVCIPAVP